MVELIVILMVVGVMAAFAVPKMTSSLGIRDSAWRDQVLASMRYAQKSAVGHRRLVCAAVTTTSVTLTIATVNPAVACSVNLPNTDGVSGVAASTTNTSAATAVSPSGVIYFQPDGRVTTDGAGTTSSTRTLTMSGADDITVNGETGYVQ